MTQSRTTVLFIDASSLFVAAKTPTGGSGYILRVCQLGFLTAATSPIVLQETERNLLAKASLATVLIHRQQLAASAVVLISVPSSSTVRQFHQVFGKDDHVMACTIAAQAEFLITLDLPLINKVRAGDYSITACTPSEFLQDYFPDHPDYSLIRSVG
jgi:predicted nucleic acid-binding protein